jgi:hypothetical protein
MSQFVCDGEALSSCRTILLHRDDRLAAATQDVGFTATERTKADPGANVIGDRCEVDFFRVPSWSCSPWIERRHLYGLGTAGPANACAELPRTLRYDLVAEGGDVVKIMNARIRTFVPIAASGVTLWACRSRWQLRIQRRGHGVLALPASLGVWRCPHLAPPQCATSLGKYGWIGHFGVPRLVRRLSGWAGVAASSE